MASIKTKIGRKKLAQAHAGVAALPKITHIAFGSGGTLASGVPKDLTGNESTLFNEVIRKPVTATFPTETTARYKYTINAATDNLIGVNINEAGLVDANGDFIVLKTFTNKGMEDGVTIEFEYDAEY